MVKLYPPQIEGTIPAFAGNELVVPFSMNRAVGRNDIAGFSLKIKTVQNSVFIAELETEIFDMDGLKAYFTLSEEVLNKLRVGCHYKLQMAYFSKNLNSKSVGYYSTVGITKYTKKPSIYIEGLKEVGTNSHDHGYLGVYRQELGNDESGNPLGDLTEKVHTSKFVITNPDNSVYFDSGEILHNGTQDVKINESTEYLEILDDLPEKQSFYIKYVVKTNNGMEVESQQYKIMQRKTLESDFVGYITAEMNPEDGCAEIRMKCNVIALGYVPVVSGAFLLSRANVRDMTKWEPLHRFILQSEKPDRLIMKDCTVEQGETYIYSLQQYNDRGLYSNRIYSEEVFADFEDSFLFDGTKQLRIRFNPKVSSFKNTILETKVDTIGSSHPFIFRNGKVCYKEFPISGLISHFMDEGKMFSDNTDFIFDKNVCRINELDKYNEWPKKTRTTNLVSENIQLERDFKLEVLDWLTNGETKLFRSPTEGNYLVRLMNVSLSPNDTLGRMLHTFSCTAYEVAKNTYNNRLSYGVIDLEDPKDTRTRWATKQLMEKNKNGYYQIFTGEVLKHFTVVGQRYIAKSLQLFGMTPGDYFYLNAPTDAIIVDGDLVDCEEYKVTIGATGSYSVNDIGDIRSIYFPVNNDINTRGIITFSFIASDENKFSLVSDISIDDVPLKTFIGNNEDIKPMFEDTKTSIYSLDKIRISKRAVYNIYENDGTYYWNKFAEEPENKKDKVDEYDTLAIYHVRKQANPEEVTTSH